MSSPRVVVLHGYQASPQDHWFGWLGAELAADGVRVDVPELPVSHAPDPQRWVATARTAIGRPDAATVIVAHSLGCVTALHALSGVEEPWTLGGLVLVAGFDRPLPDLPELDAFCAPRPDLPRIVAATAHRHVLASADDAVVPVRFSRDLAAALAATLTTVPDAGHFLGVDGHTELPAVATLVRGSLARG
ncbi:RBBP9/YdeN family alpha/beta hydrolase [Cellulomonas hominis]